MPSREIDAQALVTTLNEGPGEPYQDVLRAAAEFATSERTIYRRIDEHGIRRIYKWALPDEEAA